MNPQSRNVGNLGDVLKHAALVELAALLAGRSVTVRYVDTCTFLLAAPPADVARWRREVDAVAASCPAYRRYVAREREALARTARYRCSSGLVLDVLGDRRGAATLGEADPSTRAELREQVAHEQLADVVVVDDAVAALRVHQEAARRAETHRAGATRAVLVHVDPFALTPAFWAPLAPGLDEVCAGASDAVLVVYRYTRIAGSPWPRAPSGTRGPVADVLRNPHEVAVYASEGIAEEVREVCFALGWRVLRG